MHSTPRFLKVHAVVTKMELVISCITTKCTERTCNSAEKKYLSVKNDKEKIKFKYLGSVIANSNNITPETRFSINIGNK
jgi:hypothetical protein